MFKFHDSVIRVAEDLNVKLDDTNFYNCIGIVEHMRRNKGVIISGSLCSGKT